MVNSIAVRFDRAVTLDAGAIALVGRNGAGAGTVVTAANPAGDGRTWVLSFSGSPVVGVNIAMIQGGTISGVIGDAVVGVPAPSNRVRAEIFSATGAQQGSYAFAAFQTGATPGTVSYSASGLPPGPYKVVFASTGLVGWIDTAFGGSPCPRGGCDQSLLPTVYVTAGGTLTGIDGSLPRGSLIRGTITDAATGQAILPKARATAKATGTPPRGRPSTTTSLRPAC